MTLRRHQAQMLALAQQIKAGEDIRAIHAAVTPGGGKSALPAILADELIGYGFDALLWVVPRNALREQGEADYSSWAKRTRLRAAGNEGDPLRGYDGYVTTYQAIAADPEFHLRALAFKRFILFLDEPHHVLAGGAWDAALAPLREAADLVVYASGTFARGDGQPIAGIEYFEGKPVSGREHSAAVVYSRGDALRDGAVAPVSFRYLDGRTEWQEDGEIRSAESMGGDYAAQALFTALRTEYAFELLDEAVADWRKHRADIFPGAKLLVVAPSIALAETYRDHLHRRRIDSLIATSSDDAQARQAIARFKGEAAPSTDVLVTVAMAYEGLSVPAITHVACLTHIRSRPWLEQCFARANRKAPGKVGGFVYGPKDRRFLEAIREIEREQVQALRDQVGGEGAGAPQEAGEGPGRQWIQPLRSSAIFDHEPRIGAEFAEKEQECAPILPPSQAEALLRREIARHIEVFLAGTRPGSKAALSKIIHARLKALVGGKAREELTTEELIAQWAELKKRWPV